MYGQVNDAAYAGDSTGTVLDFFRDGLSVSCNQTWLRYTNQGGQLSAHLDSFSDLKSNWQQIKYLRI